MEVIWLPTGSRFRTTFESNTLEEEMIKFARLNEHFRDTSKGGLKMAIYLLPEWTSRITYGVLRGDADEGAAPE